MSRIGASIRSLFGRQTSRDQAVDPVDTFLCPICFGNLPQSEGYHLRSCTPEHTMCKQCIRGYVQAYISGGGAVREMTCPIGDECRAAFSPLDVAAVDPEGADGPLFQRYQRFAKQQSGKHASCPKCGYLNEGNPEQSVKMVCSQCSTKYCFHHGTQHDPDKETCDQYLRRTARAEQATNSVLNSTTCECPGCGMHVNKRSGCNHMTCRCGVEFCWLCTRRIGRGAPETVTQHYSMNNPRGCPGMQMTGGAARSRFRTEAQIEAEVQQHEARMACLRMFWPVWFVLAPIIQFLLMVLMLVFMAMVIPLIFLVLPCLMMEDDDCCCPDAVRDCERRTCNATVDEMFERILSPLDIIPGWMEGVCRIAYGDECADDC